MTRLLARYADCIFWLARYVERAENLARVLDVQTTFARDSRGAHDWRTLLRIYSCEPRFDAAHAVADAVDVAAFFVLDADNPDSIAYSVAQARENARVLRHLISTELWVQLNTFHHRLRRLGRGDVAESHLSRTCQTIKDACETHTGIADGTLYRDEAWRFYRMGQAIEMADQTTRLVDAQYHAVAALAEGLVRAGRISRWNTLLRSVAGYQAFRRRHPRGFEPPVVAAFVLCDLDFPRSVVHALRVVERSLIELRDHFGLPAAQPLIGEVGELIGRVSPEAVRTAAAGGRLHQLDEAVQVGLASLSDRLAATFFGR